ncbi:hypothetical protein, partial [Microcoleus sp. herbarium14]|uniref:hypothetical protein n=1 Tax=Microcoleus sp. herbarium14 TaxID=3055439 RepID=UPI002FD2FC50
SPERSTAQMLIFVNLIVKKDVDRAWLKKGGRQGDLSLIVKQRSVTGFEVKLTLLGQGLSPYLCYFIFALKIKRFIYAIKVEIHKSEYRKD